MDCIYLDRQASALTASSDANDLAAASASAALVPPTLKGLGAAFWHVCHQYPHRTAIEVDGTSFSYEWLLRSAMAVRHELIHECGISAGARVAVMLDNSPDYVAAFFGIVLADAVAVPLPEHLEPRRWQHIRQSCEPAAWLGRQRDSACPRDSSRGQSRDLLLRGEAPNGSEAAAPAGGADNDPAVIMYTSGSTGLAKGVMLSHRNILANTRSILEYLPIREGDCTLAILPFCHAFGNSVLMTHVLTGGKLVVGASPTFPMSIMDGLRQHRCDSFSAVPEVYAMLLRFADSGEFQLPDLRYLTVAGGALRAELAVQLAQRISPADLYVMYGQTEATARLSYLPPSQLVSRAGSIGRGIPGVQLRIADEHGQEVVPGQVGRVLARGENVMLGYWGDARATEEVLRGGWLDTGDLGMADEDGYVYLHGRGNLLVKIQGHRFHPREIEAALTDCLPGCEATVIPYVRDADETRLALFLVPPAGRLLTSARVRELCHQHLPRHKTPSYIEIVKSMPLNQNLKTDREALRRRIPGQLAESRELRA